jgi:signal transduction histidine kinase/ligand-binding sensor domain-containing protein
MRYLKQLSLLFALSFQIPAHSQTQEYRFTHIITEDIGEKADIQSLFQDQRGFMWIGSFDGLMQYDGVKSKAFKRRHTDSNSLNHNIVYGIIEDDNAIWAVTWGNGNEINRLDKQTNNIKRIQLGKESYAFDNVIKLKNGNFVIGGSDNLHFFNPITFNQSKITSARSLSTLELVDGRVMSSNVNKQLIICTPQGGLDYKSDIQNLDYQVNALLKDGENTVWLGTDKGLKTWQKTVNNIPDALKKLSITALCATSDGALWVGTATNGLYRWHVLSNNLQHFEAQDKLGTLRGNTVNVLMEDNNHLLWIGTTQGLNRTDLNPSVFKTLYLPKNNLLDNNNSFSLIEDKNGLLWVGADALYFYDTKIGNFKAKRFPIKNITSIAKINEEMWVSSSQEGVFRFKVIDNPETPFQLLEHIKVENEPNLPSNQIMKVFGDSKGNIWFGSYGKGVIVRNVLGKWHPTLKDSLKIYATSGIIQAKDGTIWISSLDNGVARIVSDDLDKPTIEYFNTKNGLSYDVTSDILEDKNGVIWVATIGGGINSINPKTKKIQTYTEENGLPSNSVVGILEDNTGTLWISTFNGLAQFNPTNQQFTVYKTKDGLAANGFKFFSKFKNKQGELFFGTNQGMVYFNPEKLTNNALNMPIYLTNLKLFNQSITPSVSGSVLTKNIASTDTLIIAYDQGVLTLEFAALFYKNPEQLQYAYQLENFDKNWNYVGNNRSATYTYPPPGKYFFKVKATSNGNNWVELQKPILLIIKPLWYQTTWFRGGLIVLFLWAIYKLFQYQRKKLIAAEHEKTREKELEQAKEIKKAYDNLEVAHQTLKSTQAQLIQSEKLASLGELTAGIAHEIQNPLNFVNNFSELSVDLVKDLKDEIEKSPLTPKGEIILTDTAYINELFDDLSQNQEKINHHGKRASSIVKGMLEHSRASTGVKELTDINKLADEYLRLSYHGLRAKDKEFNADFKTDFDENLPKIEVIPQDMGRVLLNLINNAFYAVNQRTQAPRPPEGEPYHPSVIVSTHYVPPPLGVGGLAGGQIIIKVKDNGTGMPESVKAKVFQPFFTTKPTGSGTGLGLSLAYDIVTKGHGGTFDIKTKEGECSEFIIQLPYL